MKSEDMNKESLKNIIICDEIRGNMIYFYPITLYDVVQCFDKNNRKFLGITWNIFKEGSEKHDLLNHLLDEIEERVKPWWCPKWILNLLHLFGNGNSPFKVRRWYLYRIHNWITGKTTITDIKTKFDTMRIYGYFDQSLSYRVQAYENLLTEKIQEEYDNHPECY